MEHRHVPALLNSAFLFSFIELYFTALNSTVIQASFLKDLK